MFGSKPYRLGDFDYELPPDLIAQAPAAERSASRLLYLPGADGPFQDRRFTDLPDLLQPGDLLVLNDTRVIPARFLGAKQSGGRVEVLLERILSPTLAWAQVRAGKSPKVGTALRLEDAFTVTVGERAGRHGEFFELWLLTPNKPPIAERPAKPPDFWSLAEVHGRLPLPPYIAHPASASDQARYQTIYAKTPGAVAAPTAGLHFDEPLFDRLHACGIEWTSLTLHIGAGTFQPVRVEDLQAHRMHSEYYELSAATAEKIATTRANNKRVVAVGTTSLRALEAAAQGLPKGSPPAVGKGETALFIMPGYRFRLVDALVTNFHLPRSTLLMLVSAFAGVEPIRRAYAHAIAEGYRFFSYGDAMLLERTRL